MSSNMTKSVRFAGGECEIDSERLTKRQRSLDHYDDDGDNGPQKDQKKSKRNLFNEDEMDDIDDWENEEEEFEGLPSAKALLEAKRARRERRKEGNRVVDDITEATKITDTTSLAAEGIEIDPFHMKNERSDGTGYFDGDTYVFRKRNADEEPDAWLESLDHMGNTTTKEGLSYFTESSTDSEAITIGKVRSKEEWYDMILPLINDRETIMQAVVRFGQLLKRNHLKRNRRKGKHDSESSDDKLQLASFALAQKSLNVLTEAGSSLLGLGDVDVYQRTRNDLLKLPKKQYNCDQVPKSVPVATAQKSCSKVSWEYKGNQDHQIHGPYTGEQMKAWIGQGYFVGSQAVQTRSIKEKVKSNEQDLLSDLIDNDDDDDDGEGGNNEDEFIRGAWQLSDRVDYDADG